MNIEVNTMAEMKSRNETPDILFWVGSAGSFDDRAKKITRSFVKILNHAKINFAVLGLEESASGDVAKRAGNEFLFQMQALMNIEILNGYEVKKIVTTCPHDYNTLKNEYKSLGGIYDVYHHTEYIYKLYNEKKIELSPNLNNISITYHDPCYLGRGNGIFDAPRELLKLIGIKLTEMKRSRKSSFCCGAGGAQMFKEPEKGNQDININRTTEAIKTKASKIATSCSFCNTMLSDGVKNLAEGTMDVMDICELIVLSKNL